MSFAGRIDHLLSEFELGEIIAMPPLNHPDSFFTLVWTGLAGKNSVKSIVNFATDASDCLNA